jgi:hypothetical protein
MIKRIAPDVEAISVQGPADFEAARATISKVRSSP